ncbi:MAG: TIGR02757 family protein [Candidatus Eisenbacteria bacterium]|uniref:TIGR02757 family protein n=1 Tax=Eiseniibacteriota bacterium TaxID=2212470 RepID=A0A7Y2EC70_UNCEI|nr:TIGR02757 family protein [Candidatus Eisenbacteria bacterium]
MKPELGPFLDQLAVKYGSQYLHSDPLLEVRRFDAPEDREVAGFLAASLSFGRVDLILRALQDLWDRLDQRPAEVLRGWNGRDKKRTQGFTYRWIREEDLAVVLNGLGRALRKEGSLRALFLRQYEATEPDLSLSMSRFLVSLQSHLRSGRRRMTWDEMPRGVRTFFSDPTRGAACKRMQMYFRWLVRPDDGVDLGLLPEVSPAQLTMPLDTHVARISQNLGLTKRKSVDWKMAREVTEALQAFSPSDPVKYDFALARLGILDACPKRVEKKKCSSCSLLPVCQRGRGV